MNGIRWNRAIQILYPILIYLVVYEGVDWLLTVFFAAAFPNMSISPLFPLMISALITLLPLWIIYQKVPVVRAERFFDENTPRELLFSAGVVAVGLLLNILVAKLPLEELSSGYEKANNILYNGALWLLILADVIVIPLLEELLYRGIICGQLSLWYGQLPGAFFSAVLFGIFHFNIVQFLYALIMGVLLGLLFTKTNKLYLPYLSHAITNLIVILFQTMTG